MKPDPIAYETLLTTIAALALLCGVSSAAEPAREWTPVVSPAAILVERPGITGAGWGVALDDSGARVINVYPNHPDDWGKTKGTGYARSGDGGETWQAGPDNWPFPGTVDMWVDRLKSGELVCFGIRSVPDRADLEPAKEDPYLVATSLDQGGTWEQAEAVIDGPAEIGVIARPLPRIFEHEDSAWLMPAYAFSKAGKSSLLLVSEDRGRMWRVRSVIATDKSIRESGVAMTTPWLETAVERTADGSLLAVMRTGSSAQAALVSARSPDGGMTWSAPEKVVTGFQRRDAGGKLPGLRLLPNGVLALLTAHTKNHCRLYLSPDGTGREWSEGHILTSQSGGNTSLTVLGEDKLLVCTPANGRIFAWQIALQKSAAPEGDVAAPTSVTVATGANVRVSWTAPAAADVHHYLVTPLLVKVPKGNTDAMLHPYAPIATRDATPALDPGRKLLPGATYRFEVAAVDKAGRISTTATSAEVVAGGTSVPKE